ncbi:MAG: hypothetical protein M3333_06280 [Actinomycetota bacterium]|nr:hypothetical protein [Actinomycetota bacterium]
MAAAAIGLLVLDDYSYGELLYEAPSIEVALAFPLVGALVAARRPRNPIGWILCAAGFTQGVVELTYLYARHSYVMDPGSLPGADIAAWLSTWTWIPGFGMLLTFLPLLFPSGTLLSSRWRPVAWLSGACNGAMVLLTAASKWAGRGSGLLGDVDEDIRWFTPLLLMLLGCGVASTISLILRFIRSRGVERQQVKWLAFALASLVLIFLADAFQPGGVTAFVALVIIPCAPAAIGLAILRYRLYDIDRIINRTLVYGSLTAMLGLVYAVTSLGVTAFGSSTALLQSDVVVAGATLAAAAAFQPVRRRTQLFIDRRFYRTRYDSVRTVESFSDRLRARVDLDSLTADLLATVDRTVQPEHASLWLRDNDPRG